MPTSVKRATRTGRDVRGDGSPLKVAEASPSRPAKRRKKLQDSSPKNTVEDEEAAHVVDQAHLHSNGGDQLLAQIVQTLQNSKDGLVQASRDHANAIHEANKDGVKAYAKIAALDWTYYITKLAVNIGRSSEPAAASAHDRLEHEHDTDHVHIDLGPSKMVSRQHARIHFSSKDENWFLEVKGRNGVRVNGSLLKMGQSRTLDSGDVLEIGGNEMMFVLPIEISSLHIHQTYLQRAGLSKQDATSPLRPSTTPLRPGSPEEQSSSQNPVHRRSGSEHFRQPIAPAPLDYEHPGTPPSPRGKSISQNKSPPYASSGTLLMNPNDIDLSHDDNKQIKPQYSYAQMITQAIMNTPDEKLNLNGIYNFIMDNYSYYRHQQAAGWQNSIRHNLSLNKAFDKTARSSDEPGKGMKWQIVPEARDEMIRSAYKGGRGGHRGSSAPSSPSQLNYITHGPRDVALKESGSARKRKASFTDSPALGKSMRVGQTTPERRSRNRGANSAVLTDDGSPLPRQRKGTGTVASSFSGYQPHSPTLTSSYLPDEPAPFVTPAPHRVHPRLAPPSTAQRPSQHMPTSSPAPFWKYADIGSTPLKPAASFDMSPSKSLGRIPQSSSPQPDGEKSPGPSPPAREGNDVNDHSTVAEEDEEGGFDLSKGFQSIGSYHAPVGRGMPVVNAAHVRQ